ncbi:hypothetical protein MTo_02886 [Microcystis aeruginosa NIES-1211]|uniref:Uncharacterized protein n=1 Tax=Microcystis aeruginosa NIES-2519 TaxID=2303981 RepID=A0A5A5R5R0_MICAE|nr:hypothetical protein MTo_02886 [Microcystis aeruginosa NIES-1211]GCA71330.1 hypothetical protein MiYa_02869 [Microcystis aeruginosa NIES-2519]GCA90345.1 hypothetical protein MiTa_03704 [Microcystis aeruginosa NIES-4264]
MNYEVGSGEWCARTNLIHSLNAVKPAKDRNRESQRLLDCWEWIAQKVSPLTP